jgi:F0F1-type ATP synthase delta subunit
MAAKEKRIARIVSTYKLGNDEINTILNKVPLLRNYQIENTVDPKIYGGIIITYGTKVIDLSLVNQLNNFRKTFYEIT